MVLILSLVITSLKKLIYYSSSIIDKYLIKVFVSFKKIFFFDKQKKDLIKIANIFVKYFEYNNNIVNIDSSKEKGL